MNAQFEPSHYTSPIEIIILWNTSCEAGKLRREKRRFASIRITFELSLLVDCRETSGTYIYIKSRWTPFDVHEEAPQTSRGFPHQCMYNSNCFTLTHSDFFIRVKYLPKWNEQVPTHPIKPMSFRKSTWMRWHWMLSETIFFFFFCL